MEERISEALQETVRTASLLGSNDLAFHRTLDNTIAKSLDTCLDQLLSISRSILQFVDPEKAQGIDLNDGDDVTNRWGDIIDTVDSLLERTDLALDSLKAKPKKDPEALLQQANKPDKPPLPANLRNAQDLVHPQLSFKRPPDNSDEEWQPLLKDKPNATISLEESHERAKSKSGHPYAYEIETIRYPEFMLEQADPIMYHDVGTTTAQWVDKPESLHAMLLQLQNSREIAVDLEHHDFHSYRGFVCLMQISNRDQDWIVDTLALREELQILNKVFTDPTIVKVFHGANSDIVWLQRDFGLYIVNLFDTYHASRTLCLGGHGLAFLLTKYVDFEADKRYQLADWRIRPLPKEMLYYARSDTHYLLYIYDLMRNELLEKDKTHEAPQNAMASVLLASADVALRQYYKEPYDAAHGQGIDGWAFLLNKFYATRNFDARQLEVLKAIHQWRDQTARELDESTRFVMSNSAIVAIAAALPHDLNSLLQCTKQISSTMQAHLGKLVKIVKAGIKYADDHAVKEMEEVKTATTATQSKPLHSDSTLSIKGSLEYCAQTSVFWKNVLNSFPTRRKPPILDLQLTVPIPPIREEIYEPIKVKPPIPKKEEEEVFIVKDVIAQSKRKAHPDTPDSSEARKAKKAPKVQRSDAAENKTEIIDYESQPPLLTAPKMSKSKARKVSDFKGKIHRPRQIQGGKQSTFHN